MNALGIIFSNIHDQSIPGLTARRTMASVPFGSRYRLIDFPLSNLVNANVSNIGVITHYNYQSLVDHIGTGKDWDLARRSGGIQLLPPYITAYDNTLASGLYTTRLEALAGILHFVTRAPEEYAVLSDCDTICNIDLNDILRFHNENNADITVVCKRDLLAREMVGKQNIFTADDQFRVTDITEQTSNMNGTGLIGMNILLMRRTYLRTMILDAIAHSYHDFYRDLMRKSIPDARYFVYEHKGFHASISSPAQFFRTNMQLLDPAVRADLFRAERPIYTKVRNSPPTRYSADASVTNTLMADGCQIEGTVENSIIFRGVRIGKGCVVRNSILMQDTFVGDGTQLNCVVADKNVTIGDACVLSGHETRPFFLEKGVRI